MPLPLVADSLDAIPEAARGAYVNRDGKFHLDTEVEDVTPLKAKNVQLMDETKAEKRKRQELEAKLAEIEAEAHAKSVGLTAEKLAEIKAQAEAKFRADLEERDALKQENRQILLDMRAKSLLAKANAVDVDDAWKVVGSEFDLTTDKKLILKADPTADVEAYITTALRAKKPHLFKGTEAAGGGAAGITTGGGQAGTKPVTQWTSDERRAFIEEHGPEAHRALLDQYQRSGLATAK